MVDKVFSLGWDGKEEGGRNYNNIFLFRKKQKCVLKHLLDTWNSYSTLGTLNRHLELSLDIWNAQSTFSQRKYCNYNCMADGRSSNAIFECAFQIFKVRDKMDCIKRRANFGWCSEIFLLWTLPNNFLELLVLCREKV